MTPKIIESQTTPGAAITGDCENIAFLDTKAVAKYLGSPKSLPFVYRKEHKWSACLYVAVISACYYNR